MRKAFTLVELLVVVAIIALLLALSLPVMRRVREQGDETVCRSNLRQLVVTLKTFTSDNDTIFPAAGYLYHSGDSFQPPKEEYQPYPKCCRWHDARIGLDSAMLRHDRPEARGKLWSYLPNAGILRCKVGQRANLRRGCNNLCMYCAHDPSIEIVPQYTYVMNGYLGATVTTCRTVSGVPGDAVDSRTKRMSTVKRETQVTRSPSEVFAFCEQNSWAINREGRQAVGVKPEWAAPYDLSGKYYPQSEPPGCWGSIRLSSLRIYDSYRIDENLERYDDRYLGDAFATCHRPRKGDLNTGHSYLGMLDGHVRKVTVSDQLRASRRPANLGESSLGPGGNLTLAWPLEIPPPGGWENQ